jgi:HK97 family phage major capsid protein
MSIEAEVLDRLERGVVEFKHRHEAATEKLSDSIKELTARQNAVEVRMASPDTGGSYGGDSGGADDIVDLLTKNSDFDTLRRHGKGRCVLEIKRFWPESKSAITSGSLPAIQRLPGVAIATGRRRLFMRDLITAEPTENGAVDYIEESSYTNAASPQTEASDKAESTFTFTPRTVQIQTLAHWTQASRQVLDDVVELRQHLRNALLYGLAVKEELEILSGDGTGVHQSGLITTATSFNSGLLVPVSAGWNKADVLRRAIQQLEAADFQCSGIVLNPVDWADLELTKTSTFEYTMGNPGRSLPLTLWGVPLVVTNSIDAGTFLVGDFQTGCHLRDRMDGTIDVSDSHADTFIKNVLTFRAESRFALVKTRPAAFVQGSYTTSPA